MRSLSVLCAAAAALACVLPAQAQQVVEKPVFFKEVPGPSRDSNELEGDGLRIYNGDVASRTQFPYQAALYVDLSVFCGGSLIHEKWVLTAAHCVEGGEIWYVLLGVTNSILPAQDGRKTYVTRGGVRHPDYDSSFIINDIGLVQFMRPVTLSTYIQPVALTPANAKYIGRSGTVSGFGRTNDLSGSTISSVLRYTSLPIVENNVCSSKYGHKTGDDPSVICLRAEGSSSCSGDSGGPLTVEDSNGKTIQIGTVSFGSSRGCTRGLPVGFGNVAMFIDWISGTTGVDFSS